MTLKDAGDHSYIGQSSHKNEQMHVISHKGITPIDIISATKVQNIKQNLKTLALFTTFYATTHTPKIFVHINMQVKTLPNEKLRASNITSWYHL